MKKRGFLSIAVCAFTLMSAITVMAAEWKMDAKGWWYQKDDGTYPVSTWEWIDGNGDNVAESYCFDDTGYLYINTTTPDGLQVNEVGAWTVNSVVQTKAMQGGVNDFQGEGVSITDSNLQYVIKRVNIRSSNHVVGGRMMKYDDFTGWKTFNRDDIRKKGTANNYAVDGELFCPSEVDFPECVLVEIHLNGNTVIEAIPIWIDNGERDYGGFSGYGEKGSYIVGRMEWGPYEKEDPEYAALLKEQLTEEARERAFEMYPDMIVDYTVK